MTTTATKTALVSTRCPNTVCGRPMVQRCNNGRGATPEQAFCGVWWDCPYCRTTVLFPSPELTLHLRQQRQSLALQAARQDPLIREAFGAWLANACYWDGKGYRMKADARRRAAWSKAVVGLYSDCSAFHEAAHLFDQARSTMRASA